MIAALVLAGGQATRMGGGDKVLLTLGGRTLLDRLLTTLRADHDAVAISANGDPARFGGRVPVLADEMSGQGPLAGLLAGLDWATTLDAEALLSIPGDTPLIPRRLAARLAPAPGVAESSGRMHHLVALWPLTARAPLRAWLSQPGSRSVRDFATSLGMRGVPFAGNPFANVNTPADLRGLEARLA